MRTALFLLMVLMTMPAPARGEDDHERARAAVSRGEALPLATILQAIPLRQGERLLDVEFERDDGRWVYELELVDNRGRVRELEVDARSGRILEED
jgi:uncharacterized membrane protein YkoI